MIFPLILCILDGWGYRSSRSGNAIATASTPSMDHLADEALSSLLHTSGSAVGLPDGQMGNSEVGHMNIGSGRVVEQILPRIDRALSEGSFYDHPMLIACARALKNSGKRCHILGLLSNGGVHAHERHSVAVIQLMQRFGVEVVVHAFSDGRDTAPKDALRAVRFIRDLCDQGSWNLEQ